MTDHDAVNHPRHYTCLEAFVRCRKCDTLNVIECIDVTRNMDFAIGNAMKYLWRYKHKNGLEDLRKAVWYINDAIKQLENRML